MSAFSDGRMLRHSVVSRLVGLVLVLLGLGGAFLAAVAVGLAWRAEFVVENQSGEVIEVTPVGVREASGGRRATLPLQLGAGVPALYRGAFRLAPGASGRFTYDWDDINLSELAVRRPEGAWHALVLRPGADTAVCCSTLAIDRIVVPALANVPRAPSPVARAAEDTRYNRRVLWVYLWCLGPLALLFGLWLLFRGASSAAPVARRPAGEIRAREA